MRLPAPGWSRSGKEATGVCRGRDGTVDAGRDISASAKTLLGAIKLLRSGAIVYQPG